MEARLVSCASLASMTKGQYKDFILPLSMTPSDSWVQLSTSVFGSSGNGPSSRVKPPLHGRPARVALILAGYSPGM